MTLYPNRSTLLSHDGEQPVGVAPAAAYVHIPFCRRRCYYCDFPISVVGDRARGETSGSIAEYVDALCDEIRQTPSLGQPLNTIFFGGGTPSLLSPSQLERIVLLLRSQYGIVAHPEISIEMDPGTFDLPQLEAICAAGVNRISLGVQAFQLELLKACGRTHTPDDIDRAIALLGQANVANFSLDLISGLPQQTEADWRDSLQKAIARSPAHVSIYDLTIESGTAFERWQQAGKLALPPAEASADFFRIAQQTLCAADYEHYEISNYARPGYQCQHNRVYWENRPYYGFGMGAASYLNARRFTRPRTRRDYFQWVQGLEQTGSLWVGDRETALDQLLETLMLGLRLADGLSLQTLVTKFGADQVNHLLATLQPYIRQGWVVVLEGDRPLTHLPEGLLDSPCARLRLTDPEGFLFSNVVLSTLFERFER